MQFQTKLNRREILKLISLIPLVGTARWLGDTLLGANGNVPNVLLIVLDAWSGRHLSMNGYPRRTMPNLEKFAQRATVFHRHYSAATFTVPGTASLLSGLHPWSHRAITLGSGGILQKHLQHQVFTHFVDSHSTLGYAQNLLADLLLYQFEKDLNVHVDSRTFQLKPHRLGNVPIFSKDAAASFASFYNNIFLHQDVGYDSSLFLGPAIRLWNLRERASNDLAKKDEYPRGLPFSTEQFLLSDLVSGLISTLEKIQGPTFAYLHLLPPHAPYAFDRQFKRYFHDGWLPPEKPIHELSSKKSLRVLNAQNEYYDQYMANLDAELGRFLDFLHASGLFDSSYIVFTSDHGELFEHGEIGHFTPLIYDPVIHVPLIISSPGQRERQDVYSSTSSVDIFPTLMYLVGKSVPDWAEGKLLPLFGGNEEPDRSIFSMDAKHNSAFAPLDQLTLSLTKGDFRLTYYKYPAFTKFEFYNLREDPEEMNDLYLSRPAIGLKMQDELLQKLSAVNKPFEG